jgi:hypothetical protein
MDNIFADVPYIFVYLDDILVASRSAAERRRAPPSNASNSDTCYIS